MVMADIAGSGSQKHWLFGEEKGKWIHSQIVGGAKWQQFGLGNMEGEVGVLKLPWNKLEGLNGDKLQEVNEEVEGKIVERVGGYNQNKLRSSTTG